MHLVRGLVPLRRATPRRLARLARIAVTHGRTVAGLAAAAAIRDGRAVGLVDGDGALTYDQLDRRAATVAGELHGRGVLHAGHHVGVLCRNGRGLIVAVLAASRLGADIVLLSPDIDSASLAAALREEDLHVVVHDEEFTGALAAARFRGTSIVADRSTPAQLNVRDLELLPQATAPLPDRPGRIVVRTRPPGWDVTASQPMSVRTEIAPDVLARRLPVERGSRVLILAPLAEPEGLASWAAAMVQECPVIVAGGADAAEALRLVDEHRVDTIVADDEALGRIITALGDRPGPTSIHTVVVCGAQRSGLRPRLVDAFGPTVRIVARTVGHVL